MCCVSDCWARRSTGGVGQLLAVVLQPQVSDEKQTGIENGVDWGGGIIADNAQAQHVVIRNNIAGQNLTFQIAVASDVPPANVTVDHNLIDGYPLRLTGD